MVGVALRVSAPRPRALDVAAALIQARTPIPSTIRSIDHLLARLGASRVPPTPPTFRHVTRDTDTPAHPLAHLPALPDSLPARIRLAAITPFYSA